MSGMSYEFIPMNIYVMDDDKGNVDVVRAIDWEIIATLEDTTSESHGSVIVAEANENFKSFEELTLDDIMTMALAPVGGMEYLDTIKQELERQVFFKYCESHLESKIPPKVV